MAFPLPDHLPRSAAPRDISSTILGRIDAATHHTLNAELARSWLVDLDDNIGSIKVYAWYHMRSWDSFSAASDTRQHPVQFAQV